MGATARAARYLSAVSGATALRLLERLFGRYRLAAA